MWNTVVYYWSFVPWWAMVIVIIAAIGFGWRFFALLPKPFQWAIGIFGAMIVAVQYGRNAGLKSASKKRAADNAAATQTRENIDEKIKAMPDSDVTRKLDDNKWLRDKG